MHGLSCKGESTNRGSHRARRSHCVVRARGPGHAATGGAGGGVRRVRVRNLSPQPSGARHRQALPLVRPAVHDGGGGPSAAGRFRPSLGSAVRLASGSRAGHLGGPHAAGGRLSGQHDLSFWIQRRCGVGWARHYAQCPGWRVGAIRAARGGAGATGFLGVEQRVSAAAKRCDRGAPVRRWKVSGEHRSAAALRPWWVRHCERGTDCARVREVGRGDWRVIRERLLGSRVRLPRHSGQQRKRIPSRLRRDCRAPRPLDRACPRTHLFRPAHTVGVRSPKRGYRDSRCHRSDRGDHAPVAGRTRVRRDALHPQRLGESGIGAARARIAFQRQRIT